MEEIIFKGKRYELDEDGFLANPDQWDEDFANGVALTLGIPDGLTEKHWEVIRFIREACMQEGKCPLVFQTCRAQGLRLKDLQRLFPAGYMRGACKIAGISYKEAWGFPSLVPVGDESAASSRGKKRPAVPAALLEETSKEESREHGVAGLLSHAFQWRLPEKTYTIDTRGFLVDHDKWDEQFTMLKAHEMGMPEPLTERHWQVIYFLRESFKKKRVVPTVYETCEANNLEIEDLERLFPHGYHRGAVKMAGLRVR